LEPWVMALKGMAPMGGGLAGVRYLSLHIMMIQNRGDTNHFRLVSILFAPGSTSTPSYSEAARRRSPAARIREMR